MPVLLYSVVVVILLTPKANWLVKSSTADLKVENCFSLHVDGSFWSLRHGTVHTTVPVLRYYSLLRAKHGTVDDGKLTSIENNQMPHPNIKSILFFVRFVFPCFFRRRVDKVTFSSIAVDSPCDPERTSENKQRLSIFWYFGNSVTQWWPSSNVPCCSSWSWPPHSVDSNDLSRRGCQGPGHRRCRRCQSRTRVFEVSPLLLLLLQDSHEVPRGQQQQPRFNAQTTVPVDAWRPLPLAIPSMKHPRHRR